MTVIISTCNRAKSLERALEALRHQAYPRFEVVVVNGPSTDDTDALLKRNGRDIKAAVCPEANLGRSRNIGVDIAAGEIIAFVDDDAVPPSGWLERLVCAYRDPLVMAAGGYVIHQNGFTWGITTCSRSGDVVHNADPPASRYLGKGADPFLFLPGCNMSFRRTAIIRAGGFNEDLAYGFDDVEICRRIVDAGHQIAFLADVSVDHYPEANAVRDKNGVTRDPYLAMRARAIFGLQDESNKANFDDVVSRLRCAADLRTQAEEYFTRAVLTAEERDVFVRRVEEGARDGVRIGLQGQRPIRSFALRSTRSFLRFLTVPKLTGTHSRPPSKLH